MDTDAKTPSTIASNLHTKGTLMRLALIGFGNVGQGFAALLRDRGDALITRSGAKPRLVAVATRSRGALLRPDGLDPAALLAHADDLRAYPDASGLRRDLDPLALIAASGAEVLIEASPSNLQTAQPALDYLRAAFDHGMHVITANKGPTALAYPELVERAAKAGRQLLIEGTVMAGTPCLRLAREGLAGSVISRARGILNGTTNYILTQMEGGMAYAEALALAQQQGYAETDPTADVDGWDAASKVLILSAAVFGRPLALNRLHVTGITGITPQDIANARAAGERWKLIAEVTPDGGSVQPMRIPLDHPLAGVSGATNAITVTTDTLGDVTLIGRGAGRIETGSALLSDLLSL
jgi:homoserine dehydrogenase